MKRLSRVEISINDLVIDKPLIMLFFRSNRTGQEEDIGDLDVDGDEEAIFGESQFTEADLIPSEFSSKNPDLNG